MQFKHSTDAKLAWQDLLYIYSISFPKDLKSEYFGFPDMQPGLGTTVLKANYKEWSGINQNFNIIHTELRLHRPEQFFTMCLCFHRSYLGHEEYSPLPEFWGEILPYRSSIEKSESRVAWGCGSCQKGGESLKELCLLKVQLSGSNVPVSTHA